MIDLSLARKISILSYLYSNGPVELGKLAKHYQMSVADLHKELFELFVVEFVDSGGWYESTLAISIDDDADPDSFVSINDVSNMESPSFTLAEVISLIGAIDFLLNAVEEPQYSSLYDLRSLLVDSTNRAGYGAVLWQPPALVRAHGVTSTIDQAIETRCEVSFQYWKTTQEGNALPVSVHGYPVMLRSGHHPIVEVFDGEVSIRSFRLDRMADVELGLNILAVKIFQKAQRQAKNLGQDFDGIRVTLHCDFRARWVLESVPGVEASLSEDELVLTMNVKNRAWFMSLLVRLGESVHSVEPYSIVSAEYEGIDRVLQHYASFEERC
ncbi:helix-turn-helix transcriptional regulator [Arcanobacterium ihumii]|uniref:helix-turn-helix transcriptional regulator n=1 Tax=Arcanobacterium ihumii TaxID=2138162 RepID=UPI000F5259F8|nr:WYL domain-containing protein [Arcanobacterium ihumii]